MSLQSDKAGELLRARGLRSTPQRRAILGAFQGGPTEHLSTDEVYARAAESLPDLSRGTVYATLAEFSELGLLSAFGAPEPVRYETNTTHHAHFRCRLCLRIFDLVSGLQNPEEITDPGFSVERVDTRAEGICAECNDYDAGLRAGARAISQSGPAADTLAAPGVATATLDGPLGPLLLAATPQGLTRVAFEDHGDFEALRAHANSRRGSQAARRHLADAAAKLRDYFAGNTDRVQWVIDWAFLESPAPPRCDKPNQSPTPATAPTSTSPPPARLETSAGSWAPTPSPSSHPAIASPAASRSQQHSSAALTAATGSKVTRPPPETRLRNNEGCASCMDRSALRPGSPSRARRRSRR